MSEYGRCCCKLLFVSYHAVCKATECADKIFIGQNFTPVRLHGKKNSADRIVPIKGQNLPPQRLQNTPKPKRQRKPLHNYQLPGDFKLH